MGFITTDGENKIAVKQGAGQTLAITHFVLANIAGLGAEPVNRIEAMPDAGNIMATLPVTRSGYVNGNQVVYSLVMDSSLGDYDFNWVGLKDADGVLIACAHVPLIQKRKTAGAIPGNNLTRNFLIAYSGIQATTAIEVPAETWQIDFNARLWGIDERERLSNYDIYGHEAFLVDGWKVVRQGATTTYDITPGVGYVGGIRIASAITQQVTVAGPPKSIWLDVSLQGDISDVSAVADFIIDAVGHADYTDGNGFNHYVTKIANIAADGSVTDVRVTGGDWATVPYVQKVAGGVLAKSVAGGVDVVLTDLECENGILKLTGAITANINVIVKSSPTRKWIIENATTGAFALTVKTAAGTGVVFTQGYNALVWTDGTNVYEGAAGGQSHGQCRLALSSGDLKLSPFNGNKLIINGVSNIIPAAGVTLAATGLTPTTVYYIYAYLNSGVMTLEASATGHSTDTKTGVEIKNGDVTRTLVGMARPVTGPAWSDTVAKRFVLSYFNQRQLNCLSAFTAGQSTSSTTAVELNTEIRNEFLVWGSDAVMMTGQGTVSPVGVGVVARSFIGVDGITPQDGYSHIFQDTGNNTDQLIVTSSLTLSEGYHYATLLGNVTSGSCQWFGAASAPLRCILSTILKG